VVGFILSSTRLSNFLSCVTHPPSLISLDICAIRSNLRTIHLCINYLTSIKGNIYNGMTLKSMIANDYRDYSSKYGFPWYLLHRVDLHSELRRLALNPGEGYNPATINLSSEVVDVDCEAGVLVLKDGRKVKKDLIVGADGVHVSLFSVLFCPYFYFYFL
jgi:hypothetical protein